MMMTKKTIIPPKTTGVVLLPAVLVDISGEVEGVLMGKSGDVACVVGQLQIEGCCITVTPVKKTSLVFYYNG